MLTWEPPGGEPDDPGDPNCPKCGGRGVLVAEPDQSLGQVDHPPAYYRCQCVLYKDILANVERGMKGLTKAAKVKKSRLAGYRDRDLWVTASKPWFAAHLRHMAIRRPPVWYFRVVSDADLMTSWLASIALKGKDILDPDAATVSLTHLTLVDLVQPPALLIIRLGIKQARNITMSEVLHEALSHRQHLDLPTWLWDQPNAPLNDSHRCWSPAIEEFLYDWKHITKAGGASGSRPDLIEEIHEDEDDSEENPEGWCDPDNPLPQARKRRTMDDKGGGE